ncbi:MAG: tetratricopeptide repeat protein [Bacteroidales bacterium]|nr:tetratricopeptide repeat protein [Bacteroidales bacterium]
MKIRSIFSLMLAGAALGMSAQTQSDAVQYYKADQFENAKELLQRNMNAPGANQAENNYYLGLISLRDGKSSEALAFFNKGVEADPEFAYNYVGLASLELKNGDKKGAETLLKEADKRGKKDASLQVAIARAYYDADPIAYAKEIEKYLDKARKIDMEEADIYLFEGDRKYDKKDWGGAAAQYEMGANYEQEAVEAYVKYANLFTQVNPQYAINMLNRLLQLNPNSALAQRELANAYYNNENYNEAAKAYGEYVRNSNHFKQDEDRYAFLLFYGGDYQKGYDYATQLLQTNPSNFTAQRFQFMNAAQLPAMKDRLLGMAEALWKGHGPTPATSLSVVDYNLISEELSAAKRFEEAEAVLKEGIEKVPTNADFNKRLAVVYVDENNLPAAADAFAGYLSKLEKPNFNDFNQQATYSFYAGVQTKADNPAASEKFFEDALKYAGLAQQELPSNYRPKKLAGDVAMQRASKEAASSVAAPFYEEAWGLLMASDDPTRYKNDAITIYNYLGNYYLDQKNTAKAKEYFNNYRTFDPNNADYAKFVESLK